MKKLRRLSTLIIKYFRKFALMAKTPFKTITTLVTQVKPISKEKILNTTTMKCNICGNSVFIDMNTRKNVKCKQCNSLERTRLLWMYLQISNIRKESKVLHIAPEKGIYEGLSKIIDLDNYIVADIDPTRYQFVDNCRKIDLCELDDHPSFEYDFIIHSHVLEHISCNIAYTLFHLHRMLKVNGQHICIIPFVNGRYDESFQDLSDEERHVRFGQFDHVRRFGNEDISSHLGKLLQLPNEFDATKDFYVEDLRNANIPENHWKGFHTSTVLRLKRNDMKFIE